MKTPVTIYVRSLDPHLGGPLFSSVDLYRLLVGDRPTRLLTRSATPQRLEDLGVPIDHHLALSKTLRRPRAHLGDTVVHLQHVFDPLAAVIAQVARRAGARLVLSPRGALDDWSMSHRPAKKSLARGVFSKTFWELADVVHCTSDREADQVSRMLPSAEIVVAPNVVSMAWDSKPCAVEERPRALFLSRLHAKKRPDLAIAGLAELLRSGVVAGLTVAGPDDGVLAELERIIAQERLGGHVDIVGPVDEGERERAYASHEMLVLPTSQENFGRVLFEALSCGLAVFVTEAVDTWPELSRLGAIPIDQRPDGIARAVGDYVATPIEKRRDDSARRAEAANRFLARQTLLDRYNQLYDVS